MATINYTSKGLDLLLGLKNTENRKQNSSSESQIIISSNRIIMNAKTDFLMLFGERGVAISSQNNVNIDADQAVTIYGEDGLYLGVPGKGVLLPNKKEPENNAEPTVDINYEPLVLGSKIEKIIDDLLETLKVSKIITPSGEAKFSAQTNYELECLQARLPEILSTACFIDGISHENTKTPIPEQPTEETIQLEQSIMESGTSTFSFEDPGDLEFVIETDAKDNDNKGFPQGDLAKTSNDALIVIDNQPVKKVVGLAVLALKKAAKEAGITLSVTSGFRPAFGTNTRAKTSKNRYITLTSQYTLRSDKGRWKKSGPYASWSDEKFILEAPSSAYKPATAPPNKSKHGSGIAVDFNTGGRNDFQPLKESIYIWMCNNAHKFGFVRTVGTEEWHWEYHPTESKNGPYAFIRGNKNKFYTDLGLDNLA